MSNKIKGHWLTGWLCDGVIYNSDSDLLVAWMFGRWTDGLTDWQSQRLFDLLTDSICDWLIYSRSNQSRQLTQLIDKINNFPKMDKLHLEFNNFWIPGRAEHMWLTHTHTLFNGSKTSPSKLALQIFARRKSAVSPLFLGAASFEWAELYKAEGFHNLCFIICKGKHHKVFSLPHRVSCLSTGQRKAKREIHTR